MVWTTTGWVFLNLSCWITSILQKYLLEQVVKLTAPICQVNSLITRVWHQSFFLPLSLLSLMVIYLCDQKELWWDQENDTAGSRSTCCPPGWLPAPFLPNCFPAGWAPACVLVPGVVPAQVQDFSFPLLNCMTFLSVLFSSLLKSIWMAVQPSGGSATPLSFLSSENLMTVHSAPSSASPFANIPKVVTSIIKCLTPAEASASPGPSLDRAVTCQI